jgi:hypothetical protein
MNRADWNLMTLAAAGGQPLNPVQMQKCLFLFQDAFPRAAQGDGYTFGAYHYGPFDRQVYYDAENLARQGLASVARAEPGGWKVFAATPAGLAQAAALAHEAPARELAHLSALVTWARKLSFAQIVRAVYDRHPDFRESGIDQGEVICDADRRH